MKAGDVMLCLYCKKDLPDNAIFCCYCGKKQNKKRSRRGNGSGSVYKDPQTGKYTAEITLGYSVGENLKRKRKRKKGFKTKRAALDWIEDYKRGMTEKNTPTIGELWETFQQHDLSDSKKTAYRIAWNKIKSGVEFRQIDSFVVAELQDIVDECGSSYYTKRDIKNLFSHFYKIALRDEYVTANKAQYIKLPKHETAERRIFSDADINTLWNDWNTTKSKITGSMLILLYTGMRPSELLGITPDNIHLGEHFLTGGNKTEKGRNRKIIIPSKINGIIETLLKNNTRTLCGYPYKNLFYDKWQTKRAELGLADDLTPYCCRHTYITRLTALNASPAMLQELAGHEDYETTLIYTHLSIDDRYNFVNAL